jgi:hypothetical protein
METAHEEPLFAWHVHHLILLEILFAPIKVRRKYIEQYKPVEEVERRLRLLKPVQGDLPQELVEAAQEYRDAQKAADTAYAARPWHTAGTAAGSKEQKAVLRQSRAMDRYYGMQHKYADVIQALHEQECPGCPWDGHTIFP